MGDSRFFYVVFFLLLVVVVNVFLTVSIHIVTRRNGRIMIFIRSNVVVVGNTLFFSLIKLIRGWAFFMDGHGVVCTYLFLHINVISNRASMFLHINVLLTFETSYCFLKRSHQSLKCDIESSIYVSIRIKSFHCILHIVHKRI